MEKLQCIALQSVPLLSHLSFSFHMDQEQAGAEKKKGRKVTKPLQKRTR